MQFQPWAALFTAMSLWLHLVSATEAQNIRVLGRTELRQNVSDLFLDCLNITQTSYRLYVDEGMTIILPPENRTMDYEGADELLMECMMFFSDKMSLAAEDAIGFNSQHLNSIAATDASHAWFVARGAQGLHAVGTRPASVESRLLARDKEDECALTTRSWHGVEM